MKVTRGFLSLFLLCVIFNAEAQRSNERKRWVSSFDKPIILDSLTVVPGSVQLSDSTVRGNIEYWVESGLVTVHLLQPLDSIQIEYKVFPYDFKNRVFHKSPDLYDSSAYFKSTSKQDPIYLNEKREELFTTSDLYKSGVISRGITFGNRQDIFVNSVLNLQLEGKLSDKLNILASITDQNIPYQPEGNTKLVQDFDNVFFKIYNDNFSIAGGDIILQHTTPGFLQYYRNVQGADIKGRYKAGQQVQAESNLAISVSKGKFSTYQLEVMDGIMGPYKIYGPDHEKFIIIEYNTAEITFTSNVVITRYSRVQIDFEYANQAYSRTVIAASQQQTLKKLELSVNYYQEKDNPNQPLTFDLSDYEKQALSAADPALGKAILPGWDSVGYVEDRVLYRKKDTVDTAGEVLAIFEYSSHPDSAHYQVVFTEVARGEGDYIRKPGNFNGRVYEWIAPANGARQGNYMPVKVIPLPNKKQMITINSAFRMGQNSKIFTEVALSNHNENLYNKNQSGLKGLAFKAGYNIVDKKIDFLPGYVFAAQVDYEFVNKDFRIIDRFRPVEFDRDWSYNPLHDAVNANDNILTGKAGIRKDHRNFLNIGVSNRKKQGYVNGWQAISDGMYDHKWLNIQGDLFMLDSDNGINHSRWLRYRLSGYFKLKFLYPGYEYRADRNVITPTHSDSVIYSADNFEEHRFFIRNSDTLKTIFNISYTVRKDQWPEYGDMVDRNLSRTGNVMVGTRNGKMGKFNLNVTYRELGYLGNNSKTGQESLMGRMDWSASLLKKHIRSELMYAIGNGREPKREYIFIPVPTGEGTHTWRDENNDGIQDLDEFYLAINNDERNYIKLYTPTDEYVLAYDNNLNYRISLEMPRTWKGSTGIKKFLGRFSNNLNISLKQKTADNSFMENLVFRREGLSHENLLSYRDNIRNNLYFNRADPKYGFELAFYRLRNKQLLSEGYEARNTSRLNAISRININHDYNIRLSAGRSALDNSSDYMPGRNYYITGGLLNGSLEWQPATTFRLSTDYSFSHYQNDASHESLKETSTIQEATLNFKFAKAANKNIDFSLRYAHIDFIGIENSAVGYELLKALQPGANIIWTFNWQQKLFNGMQMNLFYEGRKSGDLEVVHIGRVQVMAMF